MMSACMKTIRCMHLHTAVLPKICASYFGSGLQSPKNMPTQYKKGSPHELCNRRRSPGSD
jgi:hypothetical protein